MKWLNYYRMKVVFVVFMTAIMFSDVELAKGATIVVGPGASYDFDNIQAGIDAADGGDTVLVAPGEYVITAPITFRGKAITVKSEAGSDETTILMGTPADAERGSVVVFENNETLDSFLDGFTITGGTGCRVWVPSDSAFYWAGGGICLNNASSGTIRNCTVVENTADGAAGVLIFSGSSASLTNCTISGNSGQHTAAGAAGVLCWDSSSVTMAECLIRDNSTMCAGGGVCCGSNDSSMPSSMIMTNCKITSNTAEKFGGGIYLKNASATLKNCVITRNRSTAWGGGGVGVVGQWSQAGPSFIEIANCTITRNSGAAEAGGGGLVSWGASGSGYTTITNSIVCGNTSAKGPEISLMQGGEINVTYSNIAGGQAEVYVQGGSTLNWGVGNIDADPLFVEPGHWADINDPNTVVEPDDPNAVWIDSDYHLKSEAGRWDPYSESWVVDDVTSPCIDRGDPNADWWGELWPHGGYINMGAYGGTPQASMSLSDAGNIADLNADNVVDFQDFIDFVDAWGVEQVLCLQDLDRDGIVGPNDLVIFADNCLEEVKEARPLPLAHWKLDEIEGTIAYDSALENDAFLIGDPIWQPIDGIVDGAIELDGIDDYISTPFILNPRETSEFSVFIWIKGGLPGQVILSQADGVNWLLADSVNGCLMTELRSMGGREEQPPLISSALITDSGWHRIGFVWDGTNRILYVDDFEVASDTQSHLAGSEGGLYIGAGNNLDEGTFWTGLIDDVRIYNRAITP